MLITQRAEIDFVVEWGKKELHTQIVLKVISTRCHSLTAKLYTVDGSCAGDSWQNYMTLKAALDSFCVKMCLLSESKSPSGAVTEARCYPP